MSPVTKQPPRVPKNVESRKAPLETRILVSSTIHMAGTQDNAWSIKAKRGEEAKYVHEKTDLDHLQTKEQAQPFATSRAQKEGTSFNTTPSAEHDFEGSFGGQEDLEDRYATTSGEH